MNLLPPLGSNDFSVGDAGALDEGVPLGEVVLDGASLPSLPQPATSELKAMNMDAPAMIARLV
ncbi:hypothetical protein [Mycobacterium sp. DL592]|uniref:hypothetical protein n=1 Tax=Mycobacterium sp. DL592 TaxID=2675524 RepID=UPI001AAF52A5|nr:hypothetical protein [Mycobacterium sp. DL592]